MRGFSLSGSACAILIVAILAEPSLAPAQELTFFPSLVQTEGSFGINASQQSRRYSKGGEETLSTSTAFSEVLSVSTDGYVYHPRLEVFTVKLSGAMLQSNTEVNGSEVFRYNSAPLDYELRTTFLPFHPYNLELFVIHHEPSNLYNYNFTSGQRGETNNLGAIFSYKENPYFLTLSYNKSSVDSMANKIDTTAYRANGSYNNKLMSQAATYAHVESQTPFPSHTERDEYSYSNAMRYADAVLNSRIYSTTMDQQNRNDPALHLDNFRWTEQLYAPLPANFKADLSFLYMDENARREGGATGPAASEQFNRTTNTTVHISHQLFQSLVTNFTENRSSTTSTGGELTFRSDMLLFNYLKKIPTGMLTIDALYGTSKTERIGTLTIVNEMHSVVLGGNFTLAQQNIIGGSIAIEVRDPPTGILMPLPASNYIIQYLGGAVQITITGVSPATQQIDPAYLYEFSVNYGLSDQSIINTTFKGVSLMADIIENRLNAYFRYYRNDQELVEGSIPGGPDVNVSQIVGLSARKAALSGNLEHLSFRSRVTPLESWSMTAQYQNNITTDVHVSARLSSKWTEHFPTEVNIGYHDTIYGVSAGIDRRFPLQNITVFVYAENYMTRSIVDTDQTSLNAYVTWQKGLLSVDGGAQVHRTDTMYTTGKMTLVQQYFYVMVNRKLF